QAAAGEERDQHAGVAIAHRDSFLQPARDARELDRSGESRDAPRDGEDGHQPPPDAEAQVLRRARVAARDADRAAPRRALQAAPARQPASSMTTTSTGTGKAVANRPTPVAATAPTMSCPSPPMFHRPTRSAVATARPVSTSGVALMSVLCRPSVDPIEPSHI